MAFKHDGNKIRISLFSIYFYYLFCNKKDSRNTGDLLHLCKNKHLLLWIMSVARLS